MTQLSQRRPLLAVIGAASIEQTQQQLGVSLGKAVIEAGFRLVTGGMGGMMAAVSQGAHQAHCYCEGDVLGIIPSYDTTQANPWVDIVIPSGMQLARNVLVVASADVVIGIGGGSGTLSELALAWQLGKPVIVFNEITGWAQRVSGEQLDQRHAQPIIGVDTVEAAIQAALTAIQSVPVKLGDIGSGWRP